MEEAHGCPWYGTGAILAGLLQATSFPPTFQYGHALAYLSARPRWPLGTASVHELAREEAALLACNAAAVDEDRGALGRPIRGDDRSRQPHAIEGPEVRGRAGDTFLTYGPISAAC